MIPLCNGANYLSATLNSVLRQTVLEWEAIIVDDGSEDASVNIAQTFVDKDPRYKMVHYDGSGLTQARIHGFGLVSAESEYVTFLDHDDVLAPSAFCDLLSILAKNPSAVGAHGLVRYVDQLGRPVESGGLEQTDRLRLSYQGGAIKPVGVDQPTTFECLVVRNYMPTSGAVLLRKSAISLAMPMDLSLDCYGEWHLYARMSLMGDFAFLDRVVLDYRIPAPHADQEKERLRDAEERVRYKITQCPNMSSEQTAMARSVYCTWQRYSVKRRVAGAKAALYRGSLISATRQITSAIRPWIRTLRGRP